MWQGARRQPGTARPRSQKLGAGRVTAKATKPHGAPKPRKIVLIRLQPILGAWDRPFGRGAGRLAPPALLGRLDGLAGALDARRRAPIFL